METSRLTASTFLVVSGQPRPRSGSKLCIKPISSKNAPTSALPLLTASINSGRILRTQPHQFELAQHQRGSSAVCTCSFCNPANPALLRGGEGRGSPGCRDRDQIGHVVDQERLLGPFVLDAADGTLAQPNPRRDGPVRLPSGQISSRTNSLISA